MRKLQLAISLLCVALPSDIVAQSRGSLYIFGDLLGGSPRGRWCAFSKQPAWKAAVDSANPLTTGSVEYASGHASVIHLSEAGESGDWIVYSKYVADTLGSVRTVSRTINDLPTRRSVKQEFVVQHGRPTLRSAVNYDLETHKPADPPNDWIPDLPIRTNIRDFPFFRLMDSAQFEVRSQGKLCIDS